MRRASFHDTLVYYVLDIQNYKKLQEEEAVHSAAAAPEPEPEAQLIDQAMDAVERVEQIHSESDTAKTVRLLFEKFDSDNNKSLDQDEVLALVTNLNLQSQQLPADT